MYGLPQAGILAQELVEKRLQAHGYGQSQITHGFWKHDTRPIQFSLVVDDFGVKYVGEENAKHLIEVLEQHYEITKDWTGSKYLGLDLTWDYENNEVHLSMLDYVLKALQRFNHITPTKKQNQPYPHVPIQNGNKIKYTTPEDDSPLLNEKDKKFIQQVTGVFLYYARAVDATMLPALSAIASDQATPTQNTMANCQQFLDYAATQEESVLTYKASNMILAIHSNSSYLNEKHSRSQVGGHHFWSSNTDNPDNNGAVLNVSSVMKAVLSSAAEGEIAGLFINVKHAIPQRNLIEEMGHPQPPTPIQTDNTTSNGIANNKIQPKATKAMDMRFHWLRFCETQKQFRIYWRPGKTNRSDYYTKHHPLILHKTMRPEILTPYHILQALRKRQQQHSSRKSY